MPRQVARLGADDRCGRKESYLNIRQFAEQYNLRVRCDSCGEEIIPGRPRNAVRQEDRNHIFQHSDNGKLFGVCLLLDSKRAFGFASQRLLTSGFTQGQGFDKGKAAAEEGTLLFDPAIQSMPEPRSEKRVSGFADRSARNC
jgi:hypothetical protein